jgi:DNA-binding MarR family transcriptional regulator
MQFRFISTDPEVSGPLFIVINMPQVLTKSQRIVLDVLRNQGASTPTQLLSLCPYSPRTVRYALRRLMKMNLVRQIPCLQDMRQHVYISVEPNR